MTAHSAFRTFLFALLWEGRVQTTRTTVMMLLLLNDTIFWVSRIRHLEIKFHFSVDKCILTFSVTLPVKAATVAADRLRISLWSSISVIHRISTTNSGGASSVMLAGRWEERRVKEHRTRWFCWLQLFILHGKWVWPHLAFCFKYIHASFSSQRAGCPLPTLWLWVFPWEHAVASQFLCLWYHRAWLSRTLNGVFVTACERFKMLRGPHY